MCGGNGFVAGNEYVAGYECAAGDECVGYGLGDGCGGCVCGRMALLCGGGGV